jgi:hypothetical protein
VLVFDQVLDEPLTCFSVELIGRIGHTGTVRDKFLCVVNALLGKLLGGLAIGYQGYIHNIQGVKKPNSL